MKLTFSFLAALLFLPAAAHAQRSMSTAEVLSFVQSQVKIGDDRATADYLLHKVKLTQKLDVRSVEDLQGKGAGPQTIKALRKLAEDSAALPEPPPVVVVAPPPPARPNEARKLMRGVLPCVSDPPCLASVCRFCFW